MPEMNREAQNSLAGSDRADVESTLARIWAEVLQRPDGIASNENFFEAGGDSLAITMVLFRVKEELGVDLLPIALTESPSFREFCDLVATRDGLCAEVDLERGVARDRSPGE